MNLRNVWPVAALFAPLVASAAQQPGERPGDVSAPELERIPLATSALGQWQFAAAAQAALRKPKAARDTAARRAVAFAWVAVRVRFPAERTLAAEAAFRAGEQFRTLGDGAAAVREFECARALADDPALRSRAGVELAHAERRRGGLERALDLYLAISAQPDAPVRRRDEAALWVGKTYALLGRKLDAQRWLRHAAERATHALDRIRAFDEWAALYVALDDLEAAAGVIATCRAALGPVAAEETPLGEEVRDALDSLRSIELIERAVARRRAAARNAPPERERERAR